jgi:hypothetical protein
MWEVNKMLTSYCVDLSHCIRLEVDHATPLDDDTHLPSLWAALLSALGPWMS